MPADVDLIFLSRDLSPLREDVWRSVEAQLGMQIQVHRVTGPRLPDDPNRWATIARARNEAKRHGSARMVMLLDDDVVLSPLCVAQLVSGLERRPGFAALAADYAGEMSDGRASWDYPRHVGMGATLFRRERLEELDVPLDRRKMRVPVLLRRPASRRLWNRLLDGRRAWHRPASADCGDFVPDVDPVSSSMGSATREVPGRPTLTGASLRRSTGATSAFSAAGFSVHFGDSGNTEHVTAVCYGLFPSELSLLAQTPGVEVVAARYDGHPAVRRLRDFQDVVSRWPEETPVAYWDAGDVVFQDGLGPLWNLVRTYPDQLLTTREQLPFLPNPVVRSWVDSISDADARERAIELFANRPVQNSGFAAGTARVMARYLREAERLRESTALLGSSDWGDQTVLNLYCRSNPEHWREIATGWNFCLVGLGRADFRIDHDGWTERLDGEPLHVVHGNDGIMKAWDLVHLRDPYPSS